MSVSYILPRWRKSFESGDVMNCPLVSPLCQPGCENVKLCLQQTFQPHTERRLMLTTAINTRLWPHIQLEICTTVCFSLWIDWKTVHLFIYFSSVLSFIFFTGLCNRGVSRSLCHSSPGQVVFVGKAAGSWRSKQGSITVRPALSSPTQPEKTRRIL